MRSNSPQRRKSLPKTSPRKAASSIGAGLSCQNTLILVCCVKAKPPIIKEDERPVGMLKEGVKLSSLCSEFACGFWRSLPPKAKVIIILWLAIGTSCVGIADYNGWIDVDAPEY